MSHVTGYPARSRDRSCDRHTATATRPPPHGHRYIVTTTRPPPHGHHYTATTTWPPPHGHRHTFTATRPQPLLAGSRAGSRAGSCDESCARLCVGTFDHGNSPRALGPRALSAALGPLALTATPFLWPAATFASWPTPFVNHGRWRPSSLGGPRPLPASNLRRPLAHGAPLATIGY